MGSKHCRVLVLCLEKILCLSSFEGSLRNQSYFFPTLPVSKKGAKNKAGRNSNRKWVKKKLCFRSFRSDSNEVIRSDPICDGRAIF